MRLLSLALILTGALPCLADRVTIPLDGTWDIADSIAAEPAPAVFTHKTPVPGLAHSATPAFNDVDLFDSRELIANRVSKGDMPRSALVESAGTPHQRRNYFWYRTTFQPRERRAVALLRVNKAQFGIAVWLNGRKIGEHFGCFTAAIFDVSSAVRWNRTNTLVVRVGAHPGVLPPNVNGGTDFEKNRWTPGIYDSVSLALSDNPVIESIQVAPHIATGEITVQTVLHNYGAPASVTLKHAVKPWKGAGTVSQSEGLAVSLAAGESRTVTETVKVPNAKLWTPEEPNLYVLESETGGDSISTRFGMREFRFDTATRRAYLNGKPYFLRGSNITLHRFFEDPVSGTLPWDEAWVRKLLVDIPKKMSWNSFRFCIGPVPDKWLDIADEAGLLIQNEYFVWIGHSWHGKDYVKTFDNDQMIGEFREWMRDNWNHPSVAIWDANNETWYPDFTSKIIPAVRGLDLSNRPWENSYNGPQGADDPVEDHPYEHQPMASGGPEFKMSELEWMVARKGNTEPPTAHALILNEYGWLWLNRDGSPT
ncbi:MAG TPA: glycoside hydrolase family 2 TIM barrel-domain containing protein, partial [Bryobacteraceae bacterium]|nr:glycoside hydrolase family 2 TIM barrel-domain containing protein [Bryobacteraceae bacterium]